MASKYQELADLLRGRILSGEYVPLQQLPTEQALRDSYQVSRQTVRQALAVLAADGLIEKRQGSGSRVRDRSQPAACHQRTVAVITTYISDYIFPSILREAENTLSQGNCNMLLYATQNQLVNERKVLQTLLSLPMLDGVLVEGTKTALPNPNLDLYQEFLRRKIPLVFMNGNYQELTGVVSVLDDNYNGGYMLVKYLHGKGHTRIAGIFKSDDVQGHQRYAGYAAAMRDFGLSMEDANLYWYNTEAKASVTSITHGCPQELLDALKGCTAVVCYNDEVAGALIGTLRQQCVKIPDELAVVSFDNSQYSDLAPMRITSLTHGEHNVGRMAAESLLKCLNHEPCQSQMAPWELMEKQSS